MSYKIEDINVGDKFVGMWGYDQTQYSIYEVAKVKGKSVYVRGLGSWSHLGESDLAEGSTVKIYKQYRWHDLTLEEQQDFANRGFNWDSYEYHYNKESKEQAVPHKIVKMNRIDGQSWTYIWVLDNGEVVRSDTLYDDGRGVEIVDGLKKCLVQVSKWNGELDIKIDEVIRASYDPDYNKNAEKYAEQNLYTLHNGR